MSGDGLPTRRTVLSIPTDETMEGNSETSKHITCFEQNYQVGQYIKGARE